MIRSNIWQMQARRDIRGLVEALSIADERVRLRAVMALRSLEAVEALPALRAMKNQEQNIAIRDALTEALRFLDKDAAPDGQSGLQIRDALLNDLNSDDPNKVLAAIPKVIKIHDRTIIEHLVRIFRQRSLPPRVRLAAADALLELKSAPASASLLGALRKPEWQARRNAAAVLGQLNADWAVPPLVNVAMNDANMTVRKTAVAALKRINTTEAIQALQIIKID